LSSAAQEPQINRALSAQTTSGRYQQNAPTSNVTSGFQNPASAQNAHSVVTNAAPTGFQSLTEDLNRGHTLAQQGRFEEAKTHYEQVLRQQPNHALAHHRLAIIADKQKDFRIAEYHYRMALARSASNPDLLSDLGYSYFLQGKYRQSEQALRDALRYNPSHARSLNNLGLLYGTQGDHIRAMAMFRQAGSEQEAQSKMATLFSNGHNMLAGAAAPASAKPDHWPADRAGSYDAASVPAQRANQRAANAPNELTRQLKEEMQRARIQGRLQRQQQRIADAARTQQSSKQPFGAAAYDPTVLHPGSLAAVATSPSAYNPPPGTPGNPQSPYNATEESRNRFAQAEPVRVADSQLNRAFRDIETASGNRLGGRSASHLRDQIAQIDRSAAMRPGTNVPGVPAMPIRTELQNSATTRQTPTNTGSIRPANAPPSVSPSQRTAPHREGYPVTNAYPAAQQQQQTAGIPLHVAAGNANQARYYQTPGNAHATHPAVNASREDAQRTAALLGMNAGPSALFPTINNHSGSGQAPMARSLPGTGSRVNGSSYQAPAQYATPQGSYAAPQMHYVTPQGQYAVPQAYAAGQPAAYTIPHGGGNTVSQPYPSTAGQRSLAPTHPYAPAHQQSNTAASPPSPDYRSHVSDPLRGYQAQLKAHNLEFNSMSRKLQAERRTPVATTAGWPTQQAPTIQGHLESRQQAPQLLQRAPTTLQHDNTSQF
jgi:Tfp pilus assembly protein PilF